jgi:thioester reductase-like protein
MNDFPPPDTREEVVAEKQRRLLYFRDKIEWWLEKDAPSTNWFLEHLDEYGYTLKQFVTQRLIYPYIESRNLPYHIEIDPTIAQRVRKLAKERGTTAEKFTNALLNKVITQLENKG